MKRTKKDILSNVKDEVLSSKFVGNNTIRIEYKDGRKAYRLHDTDIIIENKDKSIILNSGGWKTITTKERINRFTPYTIFQKKGIWYINGSMFYDGITLKGKRIITGKRLPNLKQLEK